MSFEFVPSEIDACFNGAALNEIYEIHEILNHCIFFEHPIYLYSFIEIHSICIGIERCLKEIKHLNIFSFKSLN